MTDTVQKPSAFDPERFRISPNEMIGAVVSKVLTAVPVRKPGKQEFVRVSTDPEFRLDCGLLVLESDPRPYLVLPDVAPFMTNELKFAQLRLTITRQNNVFLWPVPQLPKVDGGTDNTWNRTHREVAARAEHDWVRMCTSRELGAYEAYMATAKMPDPVWPQLEMAEVLEIAFGESHVIASLDHPALRRLRGEE
jgi:hypothetical protein